MSTTEFVCLGEHGADGNSYGDLGGQLIVQYLRELQDWGILSVDKDKCFPMVLKEFTASVVVPEISIMLIMNDRFGWPPRRPRTKKENKDDERNHNDKNDKPTPTPTAKSSDTVRVLESFEQVWAKANNVRKQSIPYGRYLTQVCQDEQETLDEYKSRPNKSKRESKSRELWIPDDQLASELAKSREKAKARAEAKRKLEDGDGASGSQDLKRVKGDMDIIDISGSPAEPGHGPSTTASQDPVPVPDAEEANTNPHPLSQEMVASSSTDTPDAPQNEASQESFGMMEMVSQELRAFDQVVQGQEVKV